MAQTGQRSRSSHLSDVRDRQYTQKATDRSQVSLGRRAKFQDMLGPGSGTNSEGQEPLSFGFCFPESAQWNASSLISSLRRGSVFTLVCKMLPALPGI